MGRMTPVRENASQKTAIGDEPGARPDGTGAIGGWQGGVVFLSQLCFGVLGTTGDQRFRTGRRRFPAAVAPVPRGLVLALWLGLGTLVAAFVVLASVPPVSRDALTHHLLVPKLYLRCGGICELPQIRFSYYPMNLDLLYAIPLYFKNDIAAKYIHMAFGLMTAGLICRHLKKRLGTVYGLLGALLFLSLPVIVKLSITVYVDLGLVFFSTAAILALLRWAESGFRCRHLVLAGICCGLGLGTKYNGLVVFFLLTLFVPVTYVRGCGSKPCRSLRGVGWGICFAAAALVVFSPWMARNLVWKGNPIYPMYDTLFKPLRSPGPVVKPEAEKQERRGFLDHFTYRRLAFGESTWQIAAVPVRVFFQGKDDSPRYFDGRLNPCLLVFPLVALGFARRGPRGERGEKVALALFSALYLLFAFVSTAMRVRYIAPILPPLAILAAYGVRDLVRLTGGIRTAGLRCGARAAGGVAILFLLLPNALYLIGQFARVRPLDYLGGAVTRKAYIERHRPEYAVMDHANRHLPADAKILGMFLGGRLYYSDRPMVDNIQLFSKLMGPAGEPGELLTRLKQYGYSHLLIRYDLFEQWAADNYGLKQKEMLRRFFQSRIESVYNRHGYGLIGLAEMD